MTPPPLPPPVRSVRSPDAFSVSSLARAVDCPLSVALDALRPGAPLLAHPRAAYGRVLHELVEVAVRGRVDASEGFSRGARRVLNRLLADLPDGTPPPALVYGAADWRRRVADAVADAQAYARPTKRRHSRDRSEASPKADVDVASLLASGRDGRWTEVPLASERYRLRGRVDLVERSGDTVRVVDVKTGAGAFGGRAVAPHVALQLRTYGLVVSELDPSVHVELWVALGTATPVPFGTAERAATARALRSLSDRLPAGADAAAEDLAQPGPACRQCNWRHRCQAYQRVAPRWWLDGADYAVPTDVWGRVEAASHYEGATQTLVLRDPADRRVHVSNLRVSLSGELSPGDALYAFGLEEPAGRWRPGRRRAPLALRDVDPETGAVAWTLSVYGPRTSARTAS